MSKELIKMYFRFNFVTGAVLTSLALITPALAAPKNQTEVPTRSSLQTQSPTFFNRAPRLVRVAPSSYVEGQPDVTYQVSIAVPEDAGAALQAVTIRPAEQQEAVNLDAQATSAFLQDRSGQSGILPLNSIGGTQPDDSTVTVVFAQPVAPGQTATIEIPVDQNPTYQSVYFLDVTVYPVGNPQSGLFLGKGRLQFYPRN